MLRLVLLCSGTTIVAVLAQSSLGCFQITQQPSNAVALPSAMPELCQSKCGPNQLAVIAPLPSNQWSFQCACLSSASSVNAIDTSLCSLRCPGAPIPTQAPYCGGYIRGGVIAWSGYGVMPTVNPPPPPPPPPVVVVVPQPEKQPNPIDPIASAVVIAVQDDSSSQQQQQPPQQISVQPTSSLNQSFIASPQPQQQKQPIVPAPVAIAPPSSDPSSSAAAASSSSNNTFMISGVVGAVVVLTVGFAVVRSRRRRSVSQEYSMKEEHPTPKTASTAVAATTVSSLPSYGGGLRENEKESDDGVETVVAYYYPSLRNTTTTNSFPPPPKLDSLFKSSSSSSPSSSSSSPSLHRHHQPQQHQHSEGTVESAVPIATPPMPLRKSMFESGGGSGGGRYCNNGAVILDTEFPSFRSGGGSSGGDNGASRSSTDSGINTTLKESSALGAMPESLSCALSVPPPAPPLTNLMELPSKPVVAAAVATPLWMTRFSGGDKWGGRNSIRLSTTQSMRSSGNSFFGSGKTGSRSSSGGGARDSNLSRTASSLFMQTFAQNVTVESEFDES
ncbi:hypothetical protein BDR26DRAFT_860068 [Obelidium mucronatum]|nr:hypothetical protein BDR26DRAFT_860068 [Obelidium mucronatum]